MGNKKNRQAPATTEDVYKINTKAVDNLAKAMKEDPYQKTTKEEQKNIKNYKSSVFSKMPTWLLVTLIKWWAGGAICFFIIIGLGLYLKDTLDRLFVLGLAIGVANDLLITGGFLHFESSQKEFHKFLLLPVSPKHVWTLPIHIIIGFSISALIFGFYSIVNLLITKGASDPVLYVEPILFGVLYVSIEMSFVGIKNLVVKLINKKKNV